MRPASNGGPFLCLFDKRMGSHWTWVINTKDEFGDGVTVTSGFEFTAAQATRLAGRNFAVGLPSDGSQETDTT